eukprot:357816-Chlamydomonas_euryale.AAC.5
MKSVSHGDHQVGLALPPGASCQAVCQQLFLPTLAFKATDFCQLLKDTIALPDLLLTAAAAAAAPDGRGHLRRSTSEAQQAWLNKRGRSTGLGVARWRPPRLRPVTGHPVNGERWKKLVHSVHSFRSFRSSFREPWSEAD